MASKQKSAERTVSVYVELFGSARLAVGATSVRVDLPALTTASTLARRLGTEYPALIGTAVREDRSGLMSSYTLNLNGESFVDQGEFSIQKGDSLLLFSSQSGG